MPNKHYVYWPDIIIAVLCTCIVITSVCFIMFRDAKNDIVMTDDSMVYAEEIDEPALEEEPLRVYFDVPLDEDLQNHIFDTCEYYSVDPAIVVAMIERESRYRDHAIGDNDKSFGLMQIQPKWHMERMQKLGMYELLDPYQNVVVGVDYIHELLEYGHGLTWALMAYNGGPSYANQMQDKSVVSEYAKGIIVRARELGEI